METDDKLKKEYYERSLDKIMNKQKPFMHQKKRNINRMISLNKAVNQIQQKMKEQIEAEEEQKLKYIEQDKKIQQQTQKLQINQQTKVELNYDQVFEHVEQLNTYLQTIYNEQSQMQLQNIQKLFNKKSSIQEDKIFRRQSLKEELNHFKIQQNIKFQELKSSNQYQKRKFKRNAFNNQDNDNDSENEFNQHEHFQQQQKYFFQKQIQEEEQQQQQQLEQQNQQPQITIQQQKALQRSIKIEKLQQVIQENYQKTKRTISLKQKQSLIEEIALKKQKQYGYQIPVCVDSPKPFRIQSHTSKNNDKKSSNFRSLSQQVSDYQPFQKINTRPEYDPFQDQDQIFQKLKHIKQSCQNSEKLSIKQIQSQTQIIFKQLGHQENLKQQEKNRISLLLK